MAVCRKRSTMSAPVALSSSYFTGAPPSGISIPRRCPWEDRDQPKSRQYPCERVRRSYCRVRTRTLRSIARQEAECGSLTSRVKSSLGSSAHVDGPDEKDHEEPSQ